MQTVIQTNFRQQFRQELSARRHMQILLNVYLREFAFDESTTMKPAESVTARLPMALRHVSGHLIRLPLPCIQMDIVYRCSQPFAMGQSRMLSAPYLKKPGSEWQRLNIQSLAKTLLTELAAQFDRPFNLELLTQILNSVANTHRFLVALDSRGSCEMPNPFIASEQSLIWGHNWHPTPKSRTGLTQEDLIRYSPEANARFPLHYLAVKKGYLKWKELPDANVRSFCQSLINWPDNSDYDILPCHPWQLKTFAQDPLFVLAEREGIVKQLGEQGPAFFPTSSVRTLYQPDAPFFIKSSLHIRLTNCLRKNSWYELDSAVNLTKLLSELNHPFDDFLLMRESGMLSLDLKSLEQKSGIGNAEHLTEVFGLIFRENTFLHEPSTHAHNMAAALFSEDEYGNVALLNQLKTIASQRHRSHQTLALDWFRRYAQLLMQPSLYYFFKLGVIFEPHLQNIVVAQAADTPVKVFYRDLEGTKLVADQWPAEKLTQLSEREQASVTYSRKQGWQRLAYCLFINNLSEAIFALSHGHSHIEKDMWQIVSEQLDTFQSNYGVQPEIEALLAGGAIPCKTNFRTRLFQKADRQSGYVYLQHPMRRTTTTIEAAPCN